MGRIAFVTDSTAGIPTEQKHRHKIEIVPLQVIFGTEVFRDGVDLTQAEFFRRLRSARTLPTTSQPTVADFEQTYTKLLDDPDVGSIISVHISSKLSGTYSEAVQVAERLMAQRGGDKNNKRISVVDSQSVYMGCGLMVINGARAAEAGKGHDEVVRLIEGMRPDMRILVLIDTLEYLQRGGRIGGAQAFIGGLLNVKPILQVKDG